MRSVILLTLLLCQNKVIKGDTKSLKEKIYPSSFFIKEDNLQNESPRYGSSSQTQRTCQPNPYGIGCPRSVTCDHRDIYRTIDGTCNNFYNPLWGSSLMPFNRFLPSAYEDGISIPRGIGRQTPLPKPRTISLALGNAPQVVRNNENSLMLMQWGQYVDHDIVFTPERHETIPCCADDKNLATSDECLPLDVRGDPFYQQFSVRCLRFVRSLIADPSCYCNKPVEQINDLTSYIDASQVYGSNEAQMVELRSFQGGKLKIGPGNEGGSCTAVCPLIFLPVRNRGGKQEYFSGDSRVEEQPGLTSIHTIFVRMHNFLVRRLKIKHPEYSDETLFQEGRRIVGAVFQQITYGEFLPIILGNASMTKNCLSPQSPSSDFYDVHYDKDIDATANNVFAAAAFRFGHSLVKDIFTLPDLQVKLSESFNNHSRTLNPGSYPSDFCEGIVSDVTENFDHVLVDALRNHLEAKYPYHFGSDLLARNIMRARDHGIPPYTEWRKFCKLDEIRTFDDLSKVMPKSTAEVFRNLYSSVDDIDLFPAAISETSSTDGLVGPTLRCILEKQFHNLKVGDRFWFESAFQPKPFTMDQLKSIRATCLSALICQFTDVTAIQPEVMKPVNANNPKIPCRQILARGIQKGIDHFW
ncbi:UNVERIFIED_CONTAM: hypothetical protein RMT77_016442 [Armadillidium vulgare]